MTVTLLLSQGFRNWTEVSTEEISWNDTLQETKQSSNSKTSSGSENKQLLNLFNATSVDQIPTACLFPKINIYEPSVMKIAGVGKKTFKCNGDHMPDLTYVTKDNKLTVNKTEVKKHVKNDTFQHCRYRNISRMDQDDKDFKLSDWSKPFNDSVELSKDAEFIRVECTDTNSTVVTINLFNLIPKKEEFDEIYSMNIKKRKILYAPKETLNVIMIGMDTLFRNQFIRGCNKTYSYLMNKLNSFDLTMHSQVGINTFPNLVPMFSGFSVGEAKEWWGNNHMDSIDMIPDYYDKAGYRTVFTEDDVPSGCFHYLTKGFKKRFTMYNTRALTLSYVDDKKVFKHSVLCLGHKVEMTFHLGYLSRFLDMFHDKPVFAVAFISKPTHDDPSDAIMFDEYVLNFYKSLEEKGHLNRSLLLSFSDHGVKFGPMRNSANGHVEGKTPYAIYTFPEWFKKKYPDVMANFKANTKRLTSHFDTHATLLDLLYFKSSVRPPYPAPKHGISLFEKIPWDRTCAEAHIPSDYCLCGYTGLEEIKITSELSGNLSALVIQALNTKADKSICAVYTLSEVKNILKFSIKDGISKTGSNASIVYKIKLVAKPGDALFEANVYTTTNSSQMTVGSDISRLNLYRHTADCVTEASSRAYCYCKNLLPS